MPITLEWFDEEHTILLTTFMDVWTWEDVWSVHRQGSEMMRGLDYKVDSIMDLTHSYPYPPPGALSHLKRLADLEPPGQGVTVFVKTNRFVKALVKVFYLFFPASAEKYPFEFADTVAEAHALLTRHREEWA